MPEQGVRSTYSQCPFQIQMCDGNGVIGTGTGFLFELDDEWFLVTNWHNFSGRHAFNKQPLLSDAHFPEYVNVKLATYLPGNTSFTTVAHRVEIYDDGKPRWFEHPDMDSYCDVVALPLSRPQGCPPGLHKCGKLD